MLAEAVEIAHQAGKKILSVYEEKASWQVEIKADNSPVTQADLLAHQHIVEQLQILTPDIPVLSEESQTIPFDVRRQWQTYWLVDPLDGTKEFLKRNGEFTVNIALIEDHQPVMGVVFAPALGETYYAQRGQGAFKLCLTETVIAIKTKPVDARNIAVVGSRHHGGDKLQHVLQHLPKHTLLSVGSSLKMCLVAEGSADLYLRLGPTSEWDTAAAHCIVEEAGGRLCQTDFEVLRYNTKSSLRNPEFVTFGDRDYPWKDRLALDN